MSDVYYDPYDAGLIADPYPMFKRLRDELPLHHNEQHDFYALSRYADVNAGMLDVVTFSSAKGNILELIKADLPIPSGLLPMEDAPRHDIHRKLLSRMFTPRKIAELEDVVRRYCVRSLDPLIGCAGFDFIADLGAQMPMRVICSLLGIPEEIHEAVRDQANAQLATEEGRPMEIASSGFDDGQLFSDYVDWRMTHPGDDIVTELLNVEFVDESGVTRRLTRAELLMYISVVAAAGNETTARLIGWAAKVLAEHPGQRRELAEAPALIPNAIEELLRLEAPAPHAARYVRCDVEYYGHTVPAGSVMMMLIGAANRDHRHFAPDGDVFDIHRKVRSHLAFGVGAHYCMGAALARLEGRIALEEVLARFPRWDVDLDNAVMSTTSTVRGWDKMPVTIC
ncbi:cytochrome P450 [Mycobacterium sp. MAA66]|uniref:cytochrome P450 n=1 Tax=Mycobacterium sp. MAA66 TaxID=3156297 RepID=UPI003514E8D5